MSKRRSQAVPKKLRFDGVLDGIRTHKLFLRRGYEAGWMDREQQLFTEHGADCRQ